MALDAPSVLPYLELGLSPPLNMTGLLDGGLEYLSTGLLDGGRIWTSRDACRLVALQPPVSAERGSFRVDTATGVGDAGGLPSGLAVVLLRRVPTDGSLWVPPDQEPVGTWGRRDGSRDGN